MTLTLSQPPGKGAAADVERLLGAKVGNIRVVELLGHGGMGAVYSGVDEMLERWVALKAIRHDKRLDAEARTRFVREARVLSRLEHPHICQIYDYVESPDWGDFLVLELIKGRSLDQVATDQLEWPDKLRVALQMADVLVVAHEQGVVHRDLKPGNVMLTQDLQVKVLDFGLSRLVGQPVEAAAESEPETRAGEPEEEREDSEEAKTRLGAVMGTLSYMSPEQARGEPAGPASDIYSFGLLLQELFTGQPPHEADASPAEKLQRAKNAETRPVEGLDADLGGLIQRLKSLNSGARPSAWDTAQSLQAISDKPRRRARRLATAAAIAVLVLVSVVMALQAYRLAAERDRAEAALARAESEAAKARAINDFVQEALGSADPYAGMGRDVTLIEALSGAVGKIDASLGTQPELDAAVRSTFGRTYFGLGQFDEAETLLQSALETRIRLYGAGHLEVAESRVLLARLRWRQDRLQEAESLLSLALETQRQSLGEAHPHVLATMADLGGVLEHQDRYEEAEELFRAILKLFPGVHGDEDPRIGNALNDLAWVLYRKGEVDEAEPMFREALSLRKRALGETHPDVALTATNLGIVLAQKDQVEEAEELYRQALVLRRSVLGEDHPLVAQSLHCLASVLRPQGELDEAEELLRRAVEITSKAAGEGHTDAATHLSLLATVLKDKGDLAGSEGVQRQAVEIYRQQGAGARPMFLATALQNLAMTLTYRGVYGEAEALFLEALSILTEIYDPHHWMVANTRANLGSCLVALGRYPEAEQTLLQAYRSLHEYFGAEHRRTQKAVKGLILLYGSWGRDDEARRYRDLMVDS